ncbi:MAG: hypothetical protein ACOX8E_09345 [Ruminococcus sp.]
MSKKQNIDSDTASGPESVANPNTYFSQIKVLKKSNSFFVLFIYFPLSDFVIFVKKNLKKSWKIQFFKNKF